jgi:hypothetical protein
LFVPPAFPNITYKTFIVFGVLCFGAAAQAYVSYPETARKTLEEIEEMFRNGALRPWSTKIGGSHLEERIQAVQDQQSSDSVGGSGNEKSSILGERESGEKGSEHEVKWSSTRDTKGELVRKG